MCGGGGGLERRGGVNTYLWPLTPKFDTATQSFLKIDIMGHATGRKK